MGVSFYQFQMFHSRPSSLCMSYLDCGSSFRSVQINYPKLVYERSSHEPIQQLHPAWDGEPQEAVLQSHNYFQVLLKVIENTTARASWKEEKIITFCWKWLYNCYMHCRVDSSQGKRSDTFWSRMRAPAICQYFAISGWRLSIHDDDNDRHTQTMTMTIYTCIILVPT